MQKYQSYAARFAAKEAVFKAISECLNNKYEIEWKNIEILNDKNCRPYVNLNNSFFKNEIFVNLKIDISISHINNIAISTVLCNI